MKLLLDTCAFLWIIRDKPEASRTARALFSDANNEVFLSSVSAWEIAVKHRLGKLPLALHLAEADTLVLDKLPLLHHDPFDRMLICQAIANQMTILTPDPLITQYPVLTRW